MTARALDPAVERIDVELRARDIPRAALGRQIGLDSKQLNRLFNGERRLQRHELGKAAEWLKLADLPGLIAEPTGGMIPLYGWVGATSSGRLTLAEQNLRAHIPAHPNQANMRDAFALEVADVSMSPRYEPGEIAFVIANRWPRAGQDCVIVTTESEGLLKRFVRREADQIVLEQLNPPREITIPIARLAQVHAVVGRD